MGSLTSATTLRESENMRADPAEPPARPRHGALQIAERYGLMAVLVIAFVAFSVLLPETFPTLGNVKAMINSQAIILLLALALTLPLRSGDFDLSIAGTMTAAAAVVAQLTTTGTSIPVAIGANAVGTLIAHYLLNIFVTGLQLYGAQPWVSDVFNGMALILAVTFARVAARLSGRA
ncbi:MAG: hypothetical protein LKG20_02500 [Tetrasphaera jenkinsii]|nr:hypothetical protein [Tetrasphaera jenkinsii]